MTKVNTQQLLTNLLAITIVKELRKMSKAMDDLAQQVQNNTDVTSAAAQMLNSLADQISQAAGDEQKINEMAAQLRKSGSQLASAIAANTPADPYAAPVDPNAAPADPNAPVVNPLRR